MSAVRAMDGAGGFSLSTGGAVVSDPSYPPVSTVLAAVVPPSTYVSVPSEEQWFRFRMEATETFIEGSSDGAAWSTLGSYASAPASSVQLFSQCGVSGNGVTCDLELELVGAIYVCP